MSRLRTFHVVLLVGVGAVFLYHVLELVGAISSMPGALERGAIWAILLMIGSVVFVLAVIGGGLVRAIRSEDGSGHGDADTDAPGGTDPGAGDGGGPGDREREPAGV